MNHSVYVKVDQNNNITEINSSAFLSDVTGWIKIDEGRGDKYRHAQGNYFTKQLCSNNGVYRYKLVDGVLQERSVEETAEQEKAIEEVKASVVSRAAQTKTQTQRAIQLFAMTLPEETALEIPYVYDSWKAGRAYIVNEYLTYGVNNVGDPQLYRVAQAHTSQADWTPDKQPALYTAIGLNDSGYPIWSQPTGAQDAYNKGDIVDYTGTLYKSLIDGNVWSPDIYPAGWEFFNE